MDHETPVICALLGAGTRYEGKLFFDGRARIDGDFDGQVYSDGLLIVGEEATVRGTIRVHTLIVQGGTIEGDIHATELVELHSPAEVRGDIETPVLFIDQGVLFDGRCVMGKVLDLEGRSVSPRSAEDTHPDGYKDQPTKN
jgi:cytoskeletal protein CcmA (bactofilin family)